MVQKEGEEWVWGGGGPSVWTVFVETAKSNVEMFSAADIYRCT